MLRELLISLRAVFVTVIACSVAYPLILLVFAMAVAPQQRLGSLVYNDSGKPIGSRLIAQAFTQPRYVWPRPSAVDYNATGAGGSNLSPRNPLIRERANEIISRMRLASDIEVPADLVTASGCGLDPHISLQSAMVQIPRIAQARNADERIIGDIVSHVAHTEASGPPGGPPLVNVLLVNLELDRALPATTPETE
jgi:K+-transporting ATPase ATPase C chain